MVGAQNTSVVTSSPVGLPAMPNISLLQPGMLSASLLQGILYLPAFSVQFCTRFVQG